MDDDQGGGDDDDGEGEEEAEGEEEDVVADVLRTPPVGCTARHEGFLRRGEREDIPSFRYTAKSSHL